MPSADRGATLDYHRDWPRAEGHPRGVAGSSTPRCISRRTPGVCWASAPAARADIADFGDATLELDAGGAGMAPTAGLPQCQPGGQALRRRSARREDRRQGRSGPVPAPALGEDSGEPSLVRPRAAERRRPRRRPWKRGTSTRPTAKCAWEGFQRRPLQLGFRGHPPNCVCRSVTTSPTRPMPWKASLQEASQWPRSLPMCLGWRRCGRTSPAVRPGRWRWPWAGERGKPAAS